MRSAHLNQRAGSTKTIFLNKLAIRFANTLDFSAVLDIFQVNKQKKKKISKKKIQQRELTN